MIPNNLKPSINRIVIGDVGSGKTIVAFLIALSYLQGLDLGEVSLLAPTEVLAYQHYLKLWEMVCLESQNGELKFSATNNQKLGNSNMEFAATKPNSSSTVILSSFQDPELLESTVALKSKKRSNKTAGQNLASNNEGILKQVQNDSVGVQNESSFASTDFTADSERIPNRVGNDNNGLLPLVKGLAAEQTGVIDCTQIINSNYQNFFHNLVVVFLSGKNIEINGVKFTPAKFKVEIRKLQENNKHFFWIGTHALLFSEYITPDLVLVDEQHRFGVRQRAKLTEKQFDLQPHFVSFTATPIPRTLALTMYQSLKPHFLEKLANRNPILTRITTFDKLEIEIVANIQRELDLGYKVYVICPAVEETEDTEEKKALYSVTKATKVLQKYFGDQVFSVHGKMKEKKDILTEFKESKNKNILVATTVVEVGVDVRDASLVVILNAERFGLSALHQIRGRVGRNDFEQNYCILVTEKEFSFSKRLKYLCEYQDGFKLAEMDLELRGSGDMTGQNQSGFGDEVGEMLGLDPVTYNRIADLVSSQKVNVSKTLKQKLPRLHAYLEREKNRVWEE